MAAAVTLSPSALCGHPGGRTGGLSTAQRSDEVHCLAICRPRPGWSTLPDNTSRAKFPLQRGTDEHVITS